MKSLLLTLTLGVSFLAVLVGTSSFSTASDFFANKKASLVFANEKELIIQVEDVNEKNLPEIRKNIELNGGMTFKGYCSELKVLMYLMDTNQHADITFLNTAFMNVSMGYLIKEGTILQVQDACNMPQNIDPDLSQD